MRVEVRCTMTLNFAAPGCMALQVPHAYNNNHNTNAMLCNLLLCIELPYLHNGLSSIPAFHANRPAWWTKDTILWFYDSLHWWYFHKSHRFRRQLSRKSSGIKWLMRRMPLYNISCQSCRNLAPLLSDLVGGKFISHRLWNYWGWTVYEL